MARAVEPGRVDGHIDAAPALQGGVGQGLDLAVVAHVAANGDTTDLVDELLEPLFAPRCQDQLGALFGKALGNAPADTTRSS